MWRAQGFSFMPEALNEMADGQFGNPAIIPIDRCNQKVHCDGTNA